MGYPISLMFNYITGGDVYPYSLEELENDPQFMRRVIEHTRDAKLYSLCSDEVKKDYNFVRFMMDFFRTNEKLVLEVAEYYFEHATVKSIQEKEIAVLLSQRLTTEETAESRFSYQLRANFLYEQMCSDLDRIKKIWERDHGRGSFGTGFRLIRSCYKDSTVLKDFFAQKFLNELFHAWNFSSLEKFVHQQTKKSDSISNMGYRNYILQQTKSCDPDLFSYFLTHLYLLEGMVESLEKVEQNWDGYLHQLNQKRVYMTIHEVNQYLEEFHPGVSISVLDDVVHSLGLDSIFNSDLDRDCYVPFSNHTLEEAQCWLHIQNLIERVFEIDSVSSPNQKEEKKNAKIIYFPRKNHPIKS